MHHQNKDRILAEYPRSSPVFYEYAISRGLMRENFFLKNLEDNIVSENIENMPIAGIKNFIMSMSRTKRVRQGIVEGVIDCLDHRQGYNDVRSNSLIIGRLTFLRAHIPEDYMHKSLKTFNDEVISQFKEELLLLFTKRSNFQSAKYLFNQATFFSFMNSSIKYIANSGITFTEAEVQDFIKRHPMTEYGGVKIPLANETTDGLKDHLLLSIYQGITLQSSEQGSPSRDPILYKYLEACHPDVYKNIPGLEEIYQEYLKGSEKSRKAVSLN